MDCEGEGLFGELCFSSLQACLSRLAGTKPIWIESGDSLTYLFSFTFKQIVVEKEKIAKDGTEKHLGVVDIPLCQYRVGHSQPRI